MQTFLAIYIGGPKNNRRLVSRIVETSSARGLGPKSRQVFAEMRNQIPEGGFEAIGFRDVSHLEGGVSLDDETLHWYVLATLFSYNNKTKPVMKVHIIRGLPSDALISETAADDLSHMRGATLIGHHFAPLVL